MKSSSSLRRAGARSASAAARAARADGQASKLSFWHAAIALAASSGLVSVFGPLLGQMWWEGYLSAFGLSPEEFPASDSELRRHAFIAIAMAAIAVWNALRDQLWVLGIATALACAIAASGKTRFAARLRSVASRVLRGLAHGGGVRWHAARGAGFGLLYALALALVGLTLLCALTVLISPIFAREGGLAHGRAILAEHTGRDPNDATRCAALRSGARLACGRVVVVGSETLAVLDGRLVHRVPRAEADWVTSVPPPQAPK